MLQEYMTLMFKNKFYKNDGIFLKNNQPSACQAKQYKNHKLRIII